MDLYTEQTLPQPTIEKAPDQARIVEYADLLDTVQISIARQMQLPGSIEASSLEEVLVQFNEDEREHLRCEVGQRFDEAMIQLVTASLIARRTPLVILADTTDGINGYLPWQEPLEQHLSMLEERHLLTGVQVHVERVTRLPDTVEKFGSVALAAQTAA